MVVDFSEILIIFVLIIFPKQLKEGLRRIQYSEVLQSEPIHVSLKQHSHKWNHQGENKVDIDHLDVRGWWQAITHLKESMEKVVESRRKI